MAKTNPEAPMIKQGKWKYTWHMMKTNKACYAMLLPFMSLFIIFTVVPVVMSLPMQQTALPPTGSVRKDGSHVGE